MGPSLLTLFVIAASSNRSWMARSLGRRRHFRTEQSRTADLQATRGGASHVTPVIQRRAAWQLLSYSARNPSRESTLKRDSHKVLSLAKDPSSIRAKSDGRPRSVNAGHALSPGAYSVACRLCYPRNRALASGLVGSRCVQEKSPCLNQGVPDVCGQLASRHNPASFESHQANTSSLTVVIHTWRHYRR